MGVERCWTTHCGESCHPQELQVVSLLPLGARRPLCYRCDADVWHLICPALARVLPRRGLFDTSVGSQATLSYTESCYWPRHGPRRRAHRCFSEPTKRASEGTAY